MIRVSIDLPGDLEHGLQFLVNNADKFIERGILIGHRLSNPTLQILHHDAAAREAQGGANQRFRTPVIVYESGESAFVANRRQVRDLMAHEDVKYWLKANTFHDFSLNNRSVISGQLHYTLLNEGQKLCDPTAAEEAERTITADMAAKIRTLPIALLDHFTPYREAQIDWSQKRAIDVNFMGLIDYEVRGTNFWDEEFDKAQSAPSGSSESLLNHHRREAIRQLAEMKHLRVFVSMNRALADDLYLTAMLRSSIVVSPWGSGESSYRDYEAMLAGSIVVKPRSDHVRTFAPDIYQAEKYYIPCANDFSDLHDVIRSIMTDRERAIAVARRARNALLEENAPERIVEHFGKMFCEALGQAYEGSVIQAIPSPRTWSGTALSLFNSTPGAARGTLHKTAGPPEGLDADVSFVFTEDDTPDNSHDLRLTRSDVTMSGLYRLRCIIRPLERRSVAIKVHHAWRDDATFRVDLENGEVLEDRGHGTEFSLIAKPKVVFGPGGWRAISAFIRINKLLPGDLFIVLYAAADGKYYYSGEERRCFEIAALDIDRVDEFEGRQSH